jgi:hypothetical protein
MHAGDARFCAAAYATAPRRACPDRSLLLAALWSRCRLVLLRRMWAPIGQRPIATVHQRFKWRYRVGFAHPASCRPHGRALIAVDVAGGLVGLGGARDVHGRARPCTVAAHSLTEAPLRRATSPCGVWCSMRSAFRQPDERCSASGSARIGRPWSRVVGPFECPRIPPRSPVRDL